jgi:hypothetical protein
VSESVTRAMKLSPCSPAPIPAMNLSPRIVTLVCINHGSATDSCCSPHSPRPITTQQSCLNRQSIVPSSPNQPSQQMSHNHPTQARIRQSRLIINQPVNHVVVRRVSRSDRSPRATGAAPFARARSNVADQQLRRPNIMVPIGVVITQ